MKPVTRYARRCGPKDEKALITRVNACLATLNRTTPKAKQADLLNDFLPFVITHFHWNPCKDAGTCRKLFPNCDAHCRWHARDHQDCAWLSHVRIKTETFFASIQEKAEDFIRALLAAIAFDSIVIEASDEL